MGVGAAAATAASAPGTVIACCTKAVYVRFPSGIVALTAPSVPLGPLHVSSTLDFAHLAVGDTFAVPDRWRRSSAIWRGAVPDPFDVQPELWATAARRSPLLSEPFVHRWEAAAQLTDLAAVCRLLGGLGPGLTPSGDDALAGMLLAVHIRQPDADERLVVLADQVDTHEIARAFLVWAARGQSIEPVHRLLSGDATAAADLLAFGHTSGADLALGLWHGLTNSWRDLSPDPQPVA
jgi:hypothetical protein